MFSLKRLAHTIRKHYYKTQVGRVFHILNLTSSFLDLSIDLWHRLWADTMEGNSTTSVTQLPANVLEAFIPGFSIISGFLLNVLGFDITVVVSVGLLIFGLFASLKFLGHYAYAVFRDYFTSFVSINSTDEIFDQIMEWLDDQKISTNSRRLMATTRKRSAWDLPDLDTVAEEPDPKTLINFRNWDSEVSPKFLFYFGRHIFVHNNRYFEFDHSNNVFTDRVLRKVESIRFTCVGLSSQPIKDLLKECRDHYLNKGTTVTVVYRPVAKEDRGTTCHMWNKVTTRPSRPIDTVILNHNEKMRVLKDMNEYLHPTAMKWYANRGIPYRRGYLFHGVSISLLL